MGNQTRRANTVETRSAPQGKNDDLVKVRRGVGLALDIEHTIDSGRNQEPSQTSEYREVQLRV